MTDVGNGTEGGGVAPANVVGHVTTGTLVSPVLTVVEVVDVVVGVLDRVIAAGLRPPSQLATKSAMKTHNPRACLRLITLFITELGDPGQEAYGRSRLVDHQVLRASCAHK
jgi:hypothetical protein